MAEGDRKTTALPLATSLADADVLYGVVGGVDRRFTVGTLRTQLANFDPRRYGAVFDGVTNDSAAWQSAINAAAAAGGVVESGPGRTLINTQVTNPEAVPMHGNGTIIKPGAAVFEPFIIGLKLPNTTSVLLTANAAAGASSVSCVSPAVVGDIVYITSLAALPQRTGATLLGQSAVVLANSGTALELDVELFDGYLTADTAKVHRIVTKYGFSMSGFQCEATTDRTQVGRLFTLGGLRAPVVSDIYADTPGMIGFAVNHCADAKVSAVTLDNELTTAPWGYGIVASGGIRNSFNQISGARSRHLVTTLGAFVDDATHGGPIHTTISNSVATRPSLAGFDEHEGAMFTRMVGCDVTGGGDAGFQLRGRKPSLVASHASYCLRGVRVAASTVDALVDGGSYNDNDRGALDGTGVIVGLALRATIRGVTAMRNGQTGISDVGTDTLVTHCTIVDNEDYGIEGSTTLGSGNKYVSNFIPQSARQGLSLLNSNALFADNVVTGYGAGVDGVQGGTPVKHGNVTS